MGDSASSEAGVAPPAPDSALNTVNPECVCTVHDEEDLTVLFEGFPSANL